MNMNNPEELAQYIAKKTGKPCFYCELCHRYFYGYGNNAMPVVDGRCCDVCNIKVVIPARLDRIRG